MRKNIGLIVFILCITCLSFIQDGIIGILVGIIPTVVILSLTYLWLFLFFWIDYYFIEKQSFKDSIHKAKNDLII